MGVTTPINTDNQLNINRDIAKVFLGGNRYENETYTNPTGGALNILKGTVMGRISATGLLLPLVAAAVDGSAKPVGILTEDTGSIAPAGSTSVSICVKGDVAKEQLIFNGAETVATVVDGKQLGDRIASDTVGIKLVETTDLTAFDN